MLKSKTRDRYTKSKKVFLIVLMEICVVVSVTRTGGGEGRVEGSTLSARGSLKSLGVKSREEKP